VSRRGETAKRASEPSKSPEEGAPPSSRLVIAGAELSEISMLKAMLVLALLSPGDTFLGPKAPPGFGNKRPGTVADWIDRLGGANRALKAGKWKSGAVVAGSVLREMGDSITGGEGASNLLATALLYRALGKAGMGELDEAAWDFAVAQVFYPDYARVELAPYGAAGQTLMRARLESARPAVERPAPAEGGAEVTPPRVVKRAPPDYPRGKLTVCIQGTVVVRVVIDEHGVPLSPSVVSSIDPVFTLAALEAMRKWRFEPATIAGRPVIVYYNLTVNFRSPRCDT
jgi:TonB family protein